jgi:hypothetical protein
VDNESASPQVMPRSESMPSEYLSKQQSPKIHARRDSVRLTRRSGWRNSRIRSTAGFRAAGPELLRARRTRDRSVALASNECAGGGQRTWLKWPTRNRPGFDRSCTSLHGLHHYGAQNRFCRVADSVAISASCRRRSSSVRSRSAWVASIPLRALVTADFMGVRLLAESVQHPPRPRER